MSTAQILITVIAGVSLLLIMVLKFKISAFISLLITSMFVGILSGMPLKEILVSIQEGMGGTLGFVAVVVGLGAIFGQILESSGGAESLAHYLVKKFGTDRASWAMVITGFIVAIPVFLDVGLVIVRLAGAALIVPVMEELFWRSFLLRWIHHPSFLSVDPKGVGLKPLLASSVLFASEHRLWFAGLLAGLAYAWLYKKTGNLWVPILAHAVTNGLLGAYVLTTGSWAFW